MGDEMTNGPFEAFFKRRALLAKALAMMFRPENSVLPKPATSGASATVMVLKGSGPKCV
jgi:hypothetical protein